MEKLINTFKNEEIRKCIGTWAKVIIATALVIFFIVMLILTVTPVYVTQLGTASYGGSASAFGSSFTVGHNEVKSIAVYCRGFRGTDNIKAVITYEDGTKLTEYCDSARIIEKK